MTRHRHALSSFRSGLPALLILAVVAIAGCNGSDSSDSPPVTGAAGTSENGVDTKPPADDPKTGGDAVSLEIKSWAETEALIAAQKGKVVVVDLWSTSCVPCMKEFPNLVEMHNTLPADKITCISVSCDYEGLDEEPPESKKPAVMTFLTKTKATCTNLLLSDADVDVYEKIGLAAIPAVYVYDQDGKMVKRFDNDSGDYGDEGFTYKDHIIPLVKSLIDGNDK